MNKKYDLDFYFNRYRRWIKTHEDEINKHKEYVEKYTKCLNFSSEYNDFIEKTIIKTGGNIEEIYISNSFITFKIDGPLDYIYNLCKEVYNEKVTLLPDGIMIKFD